jgi:glycosyltransferase involved in cell wall biosynthesis
MTKLLTIAIPTFNRADALDQQLSWLTQAVAGFEADCEILVSDNGSSDRTPEVIHQWQAKLPIQSIRHPENIGVIKNIASCLRTATAKYVWTIGDDDPIQDRAVPYVLEQIKQHDDLSLLFLNFSGRNQLTGEPVHPPTIEGNRWFDVEAEDGNTDESRDGKAIFEHCLDKSIGAVIFLSAIIYRTEQVQQALQTWKEADENWICLAYLAGCCAAQGRTIVTRDVYLECIVGVSYWQKEGRSALLMQYKHTSEVLMKLEENGYSPRFCRRMIVKSFRESNLKVLLGALRRWPLFTLKTVIPFWGLVSVSTLKLLTGNGLDGSIPPEIQSHSPASPSDS